ncbi:hypothetical protein ACI2JA_19730 [Alkalihalobacillus sp. NPDC078783]
MARRGRPSVDPMDRLKQRSYTMSDRDFERIGNPSIAEVRHMLLNYHKLVDAIRSNEIIAESINIDDYDSI